MIRERYMEQGSVHWVTPWRTPYEADGSVAGHLVRFALLWPRAHHAEPCLLRIVIVSHGVGWLAAVWSRYWVSEHVATVELAQAEAVHFVEGLAR